MKTKEEEKNELDDFQWDAVSNSEEFFGQKEEKDENTLSEEEKKKIKKEVEEEDENVSKSKTKKSEKEDIKEEEEGKKEEDEKEEDEDKEDDEKVKFFEETEAKEEEEEIIEGDDFFNNLAVGLKEKGIFTTVDIPEDKNLTEEDFVNLHEKEIEARIDETFEGFFEEMDEDGKAFLKFKKEGGTTKEFFDVLKTTTATPEGDIEDETYQEKIIRHYSSTVDGMDEEEIDDRIAWLEESGKIEKYAKKYDTKLKTIQEKEKEAIANNAKRMKDEAEKEQKKFQETLKKELDTVESIKNVPFTKEEKKDLFNFIIKPTVKVGKNNYITGFQAALKNISTNNESLILLAKLVKSDFDLSSVTTQARTTETRKLRSTLERTKKNSKPTTARGSTKKELSDFF